MLRGRMAINILLGICVVFCFRQGVGFAADTVANEDVLEQIRYLKKTIREQQQKIEALEHRVSRQENTGREIGTIVPVSEIDRRIDERLSQKAPAYQLMEGLSMSVGATTIVQSVHNANGATQLSGKEDVTDSSVSTDITLNKKFEDYGEGFVYVTAGQGKGVEDELQLYSNVNYDADDDQNVRLSEAWYEHYFKSVSGALAFGKLDPTKYIDTNSYANDETTQFLGRMFRNSAVVEFPSNAGGAHFGASPSEFYSINLVAVDADADWEDAFDGMFLAGQFNLKPKLFNREGNYRFFVWNNGANHSNWSDPAKDKENGYGYGLSFDQELTDNLGIFARYGWQDPKVYMNGSDFSLEQSWSIGPQIKGVLWGRPDDVVGIGFGQIIPSNKYKQANNLQAKTESHMECYYNFKINEHLSLSPDLQVIWQPYGKDSANGDGTIVVGGLRGQLDF